MRLHRTTYGFDAQRASERPTIVFLNGLTQSTAHWRSQAKAFAETFRVVTYDARGQGETPPGDERLTLALHSADLARLLDDEGVAEAHLCGFSHGSRIALQFANDFPERVRKLVLVSATATPDALARTIIRSWAEVLDRGGLEALAWAALPAILGSRYLEASERMIGGIIKASVERNDEDGIRLLLQAMVEYPDLDDLARGVTAETLVLSGDEDLLVRPDGARQLASLCGGDHVLIEGCGHTIPIERPEVFRSHVLHFLG